MGLQAAHGRAAPVTGYVEQGDERGGDESPQRGVGAGAGQWWVEACQGRGVEPGRSEQAQGDRRGLGCEAGQQPEQGDRLRQVLPVQRIEGELPGGAETRTSMFLGGVRCLVEELAGVLRKPFQVVAHGPPLQQLAAQVIAREGECQRMAVEPQCQPLEVLWVSCAGSQVEEHLGGCREWQYAHGVGVAAAPDLGRGVAGRHEHGAAWAPPQPPALLEQARLVGVVEDEQPRLDGPREAVPGEIGGWAPACVCGLQLCG